MKNPLPDTVMSCYFCSAEGSGHKNGHQLRTSVVINLVSLVDVVMNDKVEDRYHGLCQQKFFFVTLSVRYKYSYRETSDTKNYSLQTLPYIYNK